MYMIREVIAFVMYSGSQIVSFIWLIALEFIIMIPHNNDQVLLTIS